MRKSKRQEAISKKKDNTNSSFEKQQRNTDSKELRKNTGKRHVGTTSDKTSIKLLSVMIVPLIAVAAVMYSTRTKLKQENRTFVKVTPDIQVVKYGYGGWDQATLEDENLFNTSFCNIDRRYAEDLSEEEFERNYRFKKPLLVRFRNGAAGWTKPEKWSKQSLIEEYGRWEVLSGKCDDIVKRGGSGDTKTSFLDYLKLMHDSRHKLEPMYVFDRTFYHDSDLPSTIKPPRYFQVKDKIHDSIFFLGTSRSGVSFHKHADTWNGVVYGRKRWYLYSPQRTPPGGVWPSFSQQDWVKIVYPRLRNDELPTNECIQEAGEILYLPESYYHATVNIGDTIAVAIQKKEATSRIEQIIYEAGKLEAKIRGNDLGEDSKEVRKQVNLFEELSTILPKSTEALHKLADAYSKMGNEAKAVKILEKVIRMDPWFVNARIDLARLYLLIERENDARKQFEEALKIHPEHVEGNHDYGSFLMDKGDYQKAAKLFRKAIKIKSNVSAGYFHLARALENIGDTDGARRARKKGEQLDEQQED